MEKKRVLYFDLAKGIGVFLVILGHMETVAQPFRDYIAAFHMPLFFILSGMLLHMTGIEEKSILQHAKVRARTLLIPYAWFSLLYFGIEAGYTALRGKFNGEVVWNHLYQSLCLHGASVLWFLPAMFFGMMLFLLFKKKFADVTVILTTFGLTAMAYVCSLWEKMLYATMMDVAWYEYVHYILVMVLRCFFAAAFICIGYYTYTLVNKIGRSCIANVLIGCILLVTNVFLSKWNGCVDMHYMVFGNLLLYFAGAVCGTFGIVFICRAIEKLPKIIPVRILRYYGENSIIVMATHLDFYIMNFCLVISVQIQRFIGYENNVLYSINVFAFVLLIEIVMIEVIKRFAPFLLGKRISK